MSLDVFSFNRAYMSGKWILRFSPDAFNNVCSKETAILISKEASGRTYVRESSELKLQLLYIAKINGIAHTCQSYLSNSVA